MHRLTVPCAALLVGALVMAAMAVGLAAPTHALGTAATDVAVELAPCPHHGDDNAAPAHPGALDAAPVDHQAASACSTVCCAACFGWALPGHAVATVLAAPLRGLGKAGIVRPRDCDADDPPPRPNV